MKDQEYIDEMDEMKKVFDEKDKKLFESEKLNDFLKTEIVKFYGTMKLMNDAVLNESAEINSTFAIIEFLTNRLEYLYEGLILETIPFQIN